jgi:hypothetical protein
MQVLRLRQSHKAAIAFAHDDNFWVGLAWDDNFGVGRFLLAWDDNFGVGGVVPA